MAAEDAKDDLKVSKPTLALVIETAVNALPNDAIERVMIAIHRVDMYRDLLGPAVNRVGSANAEAVGEALNRTLVREGHGLSFHAPFTSEVMKSIFRSRSRGGAVYGRDGFQREFPDLIKALGREKLDVGADGSLRRADAQQTQEPVDTTWIETCDRGLLEGARTVLREIKARMDAFETPLIIREHGPTEGGFMPPPDQALSMTRYRERILHTIKERHAIKEWTPIRGQYGSIDGFRIEADAVAVIDTLNAIHDVFGGHARRRPNPPGSAPPAAARSNVPPRSSLPMNQQAALSPEPAPTTSSQLSPATKPAPLEELGRAYGKGLASKFGEHSATALSWLIVFLVLAALGAIGWRKQISDFYISVVHPAAQSDTTSRK